jgi:hypothetical protein
MKTKERLLLGALELFNTHAASEVTTNDIARELKMSPGNLYFHYDNKEEILKEEEKVRKTLTDGNKIFEKQFDESPMD